MDFFITVLKTLDTPLFSKFKHLQLVLLCRAQSNFLRGLNAANGEPTRETYICQPVHLCLALIVL